MASNGLFVGEATIIVMLLLFCVLLALVIRFVSRRIAGKQEIEPKHLE